MASRGEQHLEPTRRLLLRRTRFILWVVLAAGAVFGGLELAMVRPLPPPFYVKVLGTMMTSAMLVVLGRPWAVRYAWPLALVVVSAGYVMTALSGMVSPSKEYDTTAVLFVAAALTTATVMPWGLRAQCATVAVGLICLATAVINADGNLRVAVDDPSAAVLIGFTLSVVTAREMNRYRSAYRRELQVRRRAEGALRRINARLEMRVRERTAALEAANQLLTEEIAERRRAAAALRESQAQLADVVDHSTAIIALKDLEGRYLLVNREFERQVGRRREDVVGRTDAEIFAADTAAALRAHDREVESAATSVSFEQELPGESRRPYVWVKFPLHSAGGTLYGIGSVATDITALNELRGEVQQHQAELAHVLRVHTIGEMAAALAHEINNPLCAITNYAQGGAQRIRSGGAEAAALLSVFEQIAHEGLRAAQVVRGVRNLVKRERRPEMPVDVNALAAEVVRVLEPQARLHGVSLRLDGPSRCLPVRGDGTQIEQVILNLALNGMEAAADGAGRREVVVATTASGESVEVDVHDTGGGVAPRVAERLFTPFFTTKASGLGLGLAISRSIIESHGGRLWVEPGIGCGATFRFSLPIADATLDADAADESRPARRA